MSIVKPLIKKLNTQVTSYSGTPKLHLKKKGGNIKPKRELTFSLISANKCFRWKILSSSTFVCPDNTIYAYLVFFFRQCPLVIVIKRSS